MAKKNHVLTAVFFVSLASCAPSQQPDASIEPIDHSQQQPQNPPTHTNMPRPPNGKLVMLDSDLYVRTLKNGVLEKVDLFPEGMEITVPMNGATVNPPYRDEQGNSAFSSTGFLPVLSIDSIPDGDEARFGDARIKELFALPGGLYISAVVGQGGSSAESTFPEVIPGAPGADYQKFYNVNGQPKFNFTAALKKKFGDHMNKARPMSSLPAAEQTKYARIMQELQKVGDRQVATARHWLMMDINEGKRLSEEFEKTGKVPLEGAWTVAVQGTAVRNGFANVPCAEFQSEILREAYARAGYSHFDDFNDKKKNRLDFKNGAAAVINFGKFLDAAGWIPWDGAIYIPPTGAFVLNGTGNSPGHAYMSGGDRGRIIVDNGMPQGRDLRVTSAKIIDMMYINGVFFLPPGFIPQKW